MACEGVAKRYRFDFTHSPSRRQSASCVSQGRWTWERAAGWYVAASQRRCQATGWLPAEETVSSCGATRRRPVRATAPMPTTSDGRSDSTVRVSHGAQSASSRARGERLRPRASNGKQSTALVTKTSARRRPAAWRRSSKRRPASSPENGTPVLPAPKRPGASPTSRIFAVEGPFAGERTGRQATSSHRRQAAALAKSCASSGTIRPLSAR